MQSLIYQDKYWGEFSENDMDVLLSICEKKDFLEVRKYIEEKLHRTDFIFGQARSDFLYLSNLDKNSVCLDIGCGLGVHTFNMAKIAKEVYACDLSTKRVRFCEHRMEMEDIKNIKLYHSDISSLPFDKEKFDFIVMNGVVEWLGEQNKNKSPRADQINDLKKVQSLLKKDGVLYIGIENRYAGTYLHNAKDHNRLKYTTFLPRFLANVVTKIRIGKPYRTYTYGISGYKKLLKDSGFDTSKTLFYIAHPGYNLPQYLIDFDDINALKFFFSMVLSGRRLNRFLSWLFGKKIITKISRHFFYSYAIFAKK